VIVDKSTVPVGTADKVTALISQYTTHPFDVVSNPEFLKQGNAVDDFLHPDRVVIGSNSEKATAIMQEIYSPFFRTGNRVIVMDVKSAEMTKYAANSFLAVKISFMNEIANLCTEVGANVDDVRKGMGADMCIGNKFLYPGCGYGGSCFPKDVRALIKTAEENGLEMKIIKAVEEVNESQKHVLFKKLSTIEGFNLEGKTIAILGLAFKPETDDMREAPSLVFINDLFNNVKDVKIRAYDPISMNVCKKNIDKDIYYAKDMYDAIKGADAIVLITEWKEFRNPDWGMISRIMNGNIVIDGRNIYTSTIPNTFFYKRIG
jgi:UDPglucose 6-dehydrogenase